MFHDDIDATEGFGKPPQKASRGHQLFVITNNVHLTHITHSESPSVDFER